MRSRLLVLPVAGALLVGTAAPASAAVTVSGRHVSGDNASDTFSVYCSGGVLSVSTSATTGDACATLPDLSVTPGGGTDSVDLSGVTPAVFPALRSVDVDLDDGWSTADFVTGSPFADRVSGTTEDTANGAGGNDTFDGVGTAFGGSGDDVFLEVYKHASGGPGDDRFIQFTASSGIEGGEGSDTWEADFDQYGGGTGADAVSFTMSAHDLTGSAAGTTQSVAIASIEHVEMALLRGAADTWQGSSLPATQHVRSHSGNDTVIGGALSDVLAAGAGADTVTGGGGSDVLLGGDDNDTIQARDGVADRVDCGAGTDVVVADAVDDVTGCESVQLPAVVAPPVPPAVPETSAVSGKAKVTKPRAATFRFTSPSAGSTFQCKVDKGAWKACASPYKIKTRKLSLGKHVVSVRAVRAGVVDPSPSVKKFRVVR